MAQVDKWQNRPQGAASAALVRPTMHPDHPLRSRNLIPCNTSQDKAPEAEPQPQNSTTPTGPSVQHRFLYDRSILKVPPQPNSSLSQPLAAATVVSRVHTPVLLWWPQLVRAH